MSEPDIQAALDHQRALPYSRAESAPQGWERQGLVVARQEQANEGTLKRERVLALQPKRREPEVLAKIKAGEALNGSQVASYKAAQQMTTICS